MWACSYPTTVTPGPLGYNVYRLWSAVSGYRRTPGGPCRQPCPFFWSLEAAPRQASLAQALQTAADGVGGESAVKSLLVGIRLK